MVEELKTAKDVVKKLGGNQVVAALTGSKHTSAVSNWIRLGKFPAKTHDVMKHALLEREAIAPKELWNIIHG